jgi:hypothetical protein
MAISDFFIYFPFSDFGPIFPPKKIPLFVNDWNLGIQKKHVA